MKLQPDRIDVTAITGYGPGWIAVNGDRYTTSLVVAWNAPARDWPAPGRIATRFEELQADAFAGLADGGPELVLFGSGSRLRFAPPAWLAPLMRQRIGIETMDTLAACRTYNILAAEGRRVVAALLVEA